MTHRKLREKDLRKYFREFNELYFSNKVPEPDILKYKHMPKSDGECSGDTVYVDSDLQTHRRLTKLVLLHEMIHLLLGEDYLPEHGQKFAVEMQRLWNIGAFEDLL